MNDPAKRNWPEPRTFRERVAWALAAHDIQAGEGYLSDTELEGLDMALRAIERRCGSTTAIAQFLDVPEQAVERYYWPLRQLRNLEQERRSHEGKEIMRAHFIAAYWGDYLGAADAAIGVLMERPEAAKQILDE